MVAIAFEGCACRAAFHAGVATALIDGGLELELAAGSSSGALCATAVAAGRGTQLPDIFRALAGRSIVSVRRALQNRTLFDLQHLVQFALSMALESFDLRKLPGEAIVVATRARDLAPLFFSSREESDFLGPLLGSCFLPILQNRPIRVRGDLLLDGMIADNLPIEHLVARGAREIIAIVNSADGTAAKTARLRSWHPWSPVAKVHVIHPLKELEIGRWDFSRDHIERAIDAGIERGRAFLRSG